MANDHIRHYQPIFTGTNWVVNKILSGWNVLEQVHFDKGLLQRRHPLRVNVPSVEKPPTCSS